MMILNIGTSSSVSIHVCMNMTPYGFICISARAFTRVYIYGYSNELRYVSCDFFFNFSPKSTENSAVQRKIKEKKVKKL